jgi:hypothetical protein
MQHNRAKPTTLELQTVLVTKEEITLLVPPEEEEVVERVRWVETLLEEVLQVMVEMD